MIIKQNRQLGIYIHIPFCVSKCIYCDFISFPADDSVKERYVAAVCKEIRESAEKIHEAGDKREVNTIFFGGGTPSILRSTLIVKILNTIKESFVVAKDAEISIECNPGTVSKEKLSMYKYEGINRLSFGLQSVNNKELKMLGRIHTYEEFEESYITARLAGFNNINIDLMSAIPGQTVSGYEQNLRKVVALKPEHISAYSLIVEEGTPLYDIVQRTKGRFMPGEEEDRRMYELTGTYLAENGYRRYEISNYAKEGFECHHNVNYWVRQDYLGFGLAAASLYGKERYTNTSDMAAYLKNPICNRAELCILSNKEEMEEFMFLGLRMMKGISKSEFESNFGVSFEQIYGEISRRHIADGLLVSERDRLFLTDVGIDISNTVMADYMLN